MNMKAHTQCNKAVLLLFSFCSAGVISIAAGKTSASLGSDFVSNIFDIPLMRLSALFSLYIHMYDTQ